MSANYIDPSKILGKFKTPWMDLYRGNSIYEKTASLIDSVLILPKAEIQKRILISYIWSNAKFCEIAPILACTGKPGTGKSSAGEIACWLHDVLALSDDSSPKGLRNVISKMKYLSEEKIMERDGALLFLDNCWNRTFKDDKALYSLWLKYKKSQDMIVLADREGEIISFRTFSHKVVSTVDLFHSDPQLNEAARRTLPIFHASIDEMKSEDVTIDPSALLKVSKINFSGFHDEYLKLWQNEQDVYRYALFLKSLEKHDDFTSHQWELMEEITATGLTIGAFNSINHALDIWCDYWRLVDRKCEIKSQLMMLIEEDFISKLSHPYVATNLLNRFIDGKIKDKTLLNKPKPEEINATMNVLGWTLTKKEWKKL